MRRFFRPTLRRPLLFLIRLKGLSFIGGVLLAGFDVQFSKSELSVKELEWVRLALQTTSLVAHGPTQA
jgi:hypothetical protein